MIHFKKCNKNFDMFIDGDRIEFVDEFQYLGIVFDHHLNFGLYVNYIWKKIRKKLELSIEYLQPYHVDQSI